MRSRFSQGLRVEILLIVAGVENASLSSLVESYEVIWIVVLSQVRDVDPTGCPCATVPILILVDIERAGKWGSGNEHIMVFLALVTIVVAIAARSQRSKTDAHPRVTK